MPNRRIYARVEDLTEIKADIHDIKINHLPHLATRIDNLKARVTELKWFIVGSFTVIAILLAVCQVFGK